jgi:hypothetical protein
MDNNFYWNLFRPPKKPLVKKPSHHCPSCSQERNSEDWKAGSTLSPFHQCDNYVGGSDTDCFLELLLCQRPEHNTLVKIWYKKYKNVLQAVKKHKIKFPVAQDNGFNLWRAHKNRYWPALYLIDKLGRARYMHFGKGRYQTTESVIRQLLKKIKVFSY